MLGRPVKQQPPQMKSDKSEEDTCNESVQSDYDSDVLGVFERQKMFEITDQLNRNDHNCGEAYENIRTTPATLTHYFNRKIHNNPKFKVKEMKVDLVDRLKMNVSDSKLKKVKRIVLEKLVDNYLDEYNKLEAYAQELRESNPVTDVVIQISKNAMKKVRGDF
ncbi:hypothetical protein A4A49_52699 [Nicotiana attenuata]|uniref:Uncharacterized protein n=1 Tax=Nicotiana attenuata TaxID=49451 RepID=A0A314L0Q1_NICAT|nr:hypothetical protein A4A49_52699 [Nicotiana attenuata]